MSRRPLRTPGRLNRCAGAITAGVFVLGIAACDGEADSVIDDRPAETASVSTEPATQPQTTEQKRAEDAAKQVIREYLAASVAATTRPRQASTKPFRQVAVGSGLHDLEAELAYYRREGYRAIGGTRITDLAVRDVDLRHKPRRQPPLIPTVEVDVCYDVSKINVVDRSGKSVVPTSRPNTFSVHYWVYNYAWPDVGGWKVGARETEQESCAN